MSHEIRTPLNAVTGLTNIVLKSELTREQRDYLNKVQIASNNLLEVINDVLDFSKVEAGRLELAHTPFDLDRTLEQLADLFSHKVARKEEKPHLCLPADLHGLKTMVVDDNATARQVLVEMLESPP